MLNDPVEQDKNTIGASMNEIDWERKHIAKVGNESIIDETNNEELMDTESIP
jgi:hypothetical protein